MAQAVEGEGADAVAAATVVPAIGGRRVFSVGGFDIPWGIAVSGEVVYVADFYVS
jgi:hypothetical protein